MYSYLETHFDLSVPICSAVVSDYVRVVNYDEKGAEVVTFEEIDYPKLQASNGSFQDWKLEALLKAGIDPAFPIKTGVGTRLEGVGMVSQFEMVADEILAESEIK